MKIKDAERLVKIKRQDNRKYNFVIDNSNTVSQDTQFLINKTIHYIWLEK